MLAAKAALQILYRSLKINESEQSEEIVVQIEDLIEDHKAQVDHLNKILDLEIKKLIGKINPN